MSDTLLRSEIIKLSSSGDWEEARLEWTLADVSESEEGATCLCGHHPIHDLCILLNASTGAEAMVGNCCAKRFLGLPSGAVFAGLKRVESDPSKSMGEEALALALRSGWIQPWEAVLYRSATGRKPCSDAQAAKAREINGRILARVKR